jgi:hypothetical protein
MEIASSKPALLTRREPAMPAHIGYDIFGYARERNEWGGQTFRLLNPEMFGLARLETLESLRLTASELEDLDSNL